MAAPRRLFFYGTLTHGSDNAVARTVHRHLRLLGKASVEGRLYAIPHVDGWYPALKAGKGRVTGYLYACTPRFGRRALTLLDRYEDCWPTTRAASIYWRQTRTTRRNGQNVAAQTYLFARPLPPSALGIEHGNFAVWLAESGNNPYASKRGATPKCIGVVSASS